MNKRGFTLIELLASIAILVILIGFSMPNLLNELKTSKEEALLKQQEIMIAAARNYMIDYRLALPTSISVDILCNGEYLSCPIVNPVDNTNMTGYIDVDTNKNYSYSTNASNYVNLTVNLNSGNTNQIFETRYKVGSVISLIRPMRSEYNFTGWTVSGTGASINGTVIKTLTIGTSNVTLTANWSNIKTFNLQIKPNGGIYDGDITNRIYQLSEGSTHHILMPIKEGYTFAGWDVDAGTGTLSNGVFTMGSSHATLTAKWIINYIMEYPYSGNYKMWVAPYDGYYKIELWGASGGSISNNAPEAPGKGAYTRGLINLNSGDILYFYVGKGIVTSADSTSFNGGTGSGGANPGGGATDVRLVNTAAVTTWKNVDSFYSRIMVAAGGGSVRNAAATGGHAGGLIGYDGDINATQTGTGSYGGFGYGGGGYGGGGGYWGGAGKSSPGPGGGGSSFISGHTGCVAIAASGSTAARLGQNDAECLTGTSDNLCSIHYSGKYFIDTLMIDGQGYTWTNEKALEPNTNPMPNPAGGTVENAGNVGNGYARITYVGL